MDLKRTHIDLNCDLGEWQDEAGEERDRLIMPWISSCNIACGGHAGTSETISRTIKLALANNVEPGAHPSYPDTANFGRIVPDISESELYQSLLDQLTELAEALTLHGGKLHHIKPHGALYNHAARDHQTAELLADIVYRHFPGVPMYLPPASVSKTVAEQAGIPVVMEVFADRRYEDDLSLRDRRHGDAVLYEKDAVIRQLDQLLQAGSVTTYSGSVQAIVAETVCLHSDTPGSIELAKHIHEYIRRHGIRITAP